MTSPPEAGPGPATAGATPSAPDPAPDDTGTLHGRRAQVVGTGLIGGSLGLALRQRGWKVSGVDADPARAEEALSAGALDAVGEDLDAELIFIAVPAAQAGSLAAAVLADPARRTDAVVSDVSGVKAAVVRAAGHPRFVGGHPMAGSEQVGLRGADPDLFVGATWVLTPTPTTDVLAFSAVRSVVKSLGAEVVVLPAEDHDRLVAVVSHVPHLVAATLMNAAALAAEADSALLQLAAGGFRDMTRVAAGHPGIWPDICADNAAEITATLDHLIGDLTTLRHQVAGAEREALLAMLDKASTARRALPSRATRPDDLAEIRVPIPDRPHEIERIAAAAGGLGTNIYDFEIAHSAEGARGVALLVVESARADALQAALVAKGYRCTVHPLG